MEDLNLFSPIVSRVTTDVLTFWSDFTYNGIIIKFSSVFVASLVLLVPMDGSNRLPLDSCACLPPYKKGCHEQSWPKVECPF